jgi:hypothetical protein
MHKLLIVSNSRLQNDVFLSLVPMFLFRVLFSKQFCFLLLIYLCSHVVSDISLGVWRMENTAPCRFTDCINKFG